MTAENKKSRFYIVNTVNDAKDKMEDRVKSYNEKYVKKNLAAAREFFTELKGDPVKTIDDLIYDSRETLRKVKSERVETVQKKVDTTKEEVRGKMEKANRTGKEIFKKIENDFKLLREDIIAMGKKNLDRIPMKKNLEKKISEGVDSIPSKLNLPSKSEIDNLIVGIDGVSKKVDALSCQTAGA
ncbi:MAG: hypothetical protein V2I97_10675 [Desulfococcaceae bacterium]|nr:hypothetical protein [Desulfococcaceae bacterium]